MPRKKTHYYFIYGLKVKSAVSSHRIFTSYKPTHTYDFDVEIKFGKVTDVLDRQMITNNWTRFSENDYLYLSYCELPVFNKKLFF